MHFLADVIDPPFPDRDEQEREKAEIAMLLVAPGKAATGQIAVVLRDLVVNGEPSIARDLRDDPLGCHIHLDKEELTATALDVLNNEGSVGNDAVFSHFWLPHKVGGFAHDFGADLDPSVLDEGAQHRELRTGSNTQFSCNHEVNRVQPMVHLWRPFRLHKCLFMRAYKFVGYVPLPLQKLVAFALEIVDFWGLAVTALPNVAEVA